MNDSSPLYTGIVTFNDSLDCQTPVGGHPHGLLQFYKMFCLFIGPLNALLNGLCVHIFKHPLWKKSAMSGLLKGLSIIELCMGICLFTYALWEAISSPTSGFIFIDSWATDQARHHVTIILFYFNIFMTQCLLLFQVARNWSVVLLAAYRYDRICRPIGTGTVFPRKRIPKLLIIVVILSGILCLPRAFEFGLIVCSVDGKYAGSPKLLMSSEFYQIAYLGIVTFIIQSGGPVICVCVLSAFVIRLICKRRAIHKRNEQKSARNLLRAMRESEPDISQPSKRNSSSACSNNLTTLHNERPSPSGDKLIFAVCVTFAILETPAFFSKILNPYLEEHYALIDHCLSVFANVFIYLDSTLNAFVYMASNPTFRKVAKQTYWPGKGRNSSINSTN